MPEVRDIFGFSAMSEGMRVAITRARYKHYVEGQEFEEAFDAHTMPTVRPVDGSPPPRKELSAEEIARQIQKQAHREK